MKKPEIIAAAIAAAALMLTASASAAPSRVAGAPGGLTTAGRDLWNFEALLQDVFHTKRNIIVRGTSLNFEQYPSHAGAAAPPQAAFEWYAPVFANAAHSSFHLSNRPVHNGQFGNYPELVRIAGHPIACDQGDAKFLTTFGDAVNLDLACMAPGS